jgi:flagellar basal body-associated protein FliL
MMNHILLLDVAPDPVSAGVGIAGLIMIGVVVLMITAAVLVGFVFLFKRLRRNDAGGSTRLVVGDICLNLDKAASQSNPQPQSSPNQP